LNILELQHIDIICLAVPSENLAPLIFTSRGKAFEYFALLCKQGGSWEEFELNCKGGRLGDQARDAAVDLVKTRRPKDQLRTDVLKLVLKSIGKETL
jgi:hypothetical protein